MHNELDFSLLTEIMNTMNEGLFLVNPAGQISLANDTFLQMLGYTWEEIEGKPCSILECDVCEWSRAKGGAHWCRLFESRKESRKRCWIRRKDGSYLHVLKNASLLTQKGQIKGGVETITDISQLDVRDRTIKGLKRLLNSEDTFQGMVGKSEKMRKTFSLLEKAAQSDAPVIIFGESGTGKELAARAIHDLGLRKEGPFIQLNCAALNESLMESELFGHTKGAFTGAVRHRQGRFEAAHQGDIFLDEVGDVPLSIQVKLLRVLETQKFERVGDHRPLSVDVRIITATNRDLQALIQQGLFREDLFFRINVIPIHLPPLRERSEDIPLLAEKCIQDLRKKSGKEIRGLSPEALQLFIDYKWPGNVRELKSALQYAFVICESTLIQIEHLPAYLLEQDRFSESAGQETQGLAASDEKMELIEALRQTGGNKSKTARILGINRVTVLNRMRKYGIDMKTDIYY
jgi:PAS domain S-box-containing protein